MKESKFKEVDKPSDRKLRYNGPCSKCNKNTDQRFTSATHNENEYQCMKCKTKNIEKK